MNSGTVTAKVVVLRIKSHIMKSYHCKGMVDKASQLLTYLYRINYANYSNKEKK